MMIRIITTTIIRIMIILIIIIVVVVSTQIRNLRCAPEDLNEQEGLIVHNHYHFSSGGDIRSPRHLIGKRQDNNDHQ